MVAGEIFIHREKQNGNLLFKVSTYMGQLKLEDIIIDVEKKNIKNINLRVYPPHGRVCISAPRRMNQDAIHAFALSKLNWIKKQQTKLRSRVREQPRDFTDGESHYFNGNSYRLQVMEANTPPGIELKQQEMILVVRPDTTVDKMQIILDEWYRAQLKKVIPELVKKWENRMKVQVHDFGVKKMKTRWGTCNRKANRIWLNLELAKRSPECLEYVVVHEMVHLLERHHNGHFYSLLDEFYPDWRLYKTELSNTAAI